jgi:hypothetical protein
MTATYTVTLRGEHRKFADLEANARLVAADFWGKRGFVIESISTVAEDDRQAATITTRALALVAS